VNTGLGDSAKGSHRMEQGQECIPETSGWAIQGGKARKKLKRLYPIINLSM